EHGVDGGHFQTGGADGAVQAHRGAQMLGVYVRPETIVGQGERLGGAGGDKAALDHGLALNKSAVAGASQRRSQPADQPRAAGVAGYAQSAGAAMVAGSVAGSCISAEA